MVNNYSVKHLETGFLTHSLDLAYDFSYKTFFDKIFRQVCIKNDRYSVILYRYMSFFLGCINKKVAFFKLNLCTVNNKFYLAVGFKLVHKRCSVGFSECCADFRYKLTVFRAECTKLRFEFICYKSFNIICKLYLLYVQLIKNDTCIHFGKRSFSSYKHCSDRLSVLDISFVSCSTSEYDYVKYKIHVFFKVFVYPFLNSFGEIAKMYAFGNRIVNLNNYVSVDFLGNIRCKRSRNLSQC